MALLIGETLSVGQRLTETKGRTTGFDYLRIGLSTAVILFHTVMTCYGGDANRPLETGWSRPFIVVIIPAFFALSGFLVAGSLARSKTLAEFLTLRVVRLVPALFFEVLISALIIGPLLTSFDLVDYFRDHSFRAYFLNIIGEIHYTLPGLFLTNPDPNIVNRQLWTIPIELECYAVLAALYVVGIVSRKVLLLFAGLLLLVAAPLIDYRSGVDIASFNNVPKKVLLECFIAGVTIFVFRSSLPLSKTLFFICLALSYAALLGRYSSYVACVPVAYATVYIGLTNTKANVVSRAGEYSYGLYIYGYVIQQMYAHLFPDYRNWWLNFLVAFPVTLALSYASWKLVEEPVLLKRKYAVNIVVMLDSAIKRRLGLFPKTANSTS